MIRNCRILRVNYFSFMNTTISQKTIASFLVLTFLFTFFSSASFAQRRGRTTTPNKQQTAKVPIEKSDEVCEGWRGKITYTQNINDERLNNKGEFGYEKYTRVVQVNAEVVLAGGRSGVGKVSVLKKDISDTEDRRRADCGDWNTPIRKNTFVEKYFNQTEETGEASGSVPVTVWMRDGNYNFDISMPAARGKFVMQGKHSQKGYCTASADNEETGAPMEQSKEFESLRIYAEGKIDPKNPNTLRGSVKYDPNITVTWDLTRTTSGNCDEGELSVAGVKLEHHVFPNPTEWEQIGENTIDGNRVKITATISNSSKKPKSGTVIFKELTNGETIGGQAVNVPGEGEAEVNVEWDTDGFAWTDNKKNAPQREIEVRLMDGDSTSEKIWVHPKPVILIHGLWSNAAAWADYHNYLEEAHSFAWRAYAVGADPKVAEMHTGDHFGNVQPTFSIRQNAQELSKQILQTQKDENAWHVDIVAHSMGGLISRYYIHQLMKDSPDGKPLVKNLVMLGTPNQGSPWADIMYEEYRKKGFEVEALRELKTDVCRDFNSQITNRKGVKFAIIYTDKIPFTGDTLEPGDGVVSYSSAVWQISDVSRSDSFDHTSLTGRDDFMRFVYPRLALGPKKAKQTASLNKNFDGDSLALNRIGKNWVASFTMSEDNSFSVISRTLNQKHYRHEIPATKN